MRRRRVCHTTRSASPSVERRFSPRVPRWRGVYGSESIDERVDCVLAGRLSRATSSSDRQKRKEELGMTNLLSSIPGERSQPPRGPASETDRTNLQEMNPIPHWRRADRSSLSPMRRPFEISATDYPQFDQKNVVMKLLLHRPSVSKPAFELNTSTSNRFPLETSPPGHLPSEKIGALDQNSHTRLRKLLSPSHLEDIPSSSLFLNSLNHDHARNGSSKMSSSKRVSPQRQNNQRNGPLQSLSSPSCSTAGSAQDCNRRSNFLSQWKADVSNDECYCEGFDVDEEIKVDLIEDSSEKKGLFRKRPESKLEDTEGCREIHSPVSFRSISTRKQRSQRARVLSTLQSNGHLKQSTRSFLSTPDSSSSSPLSLLFFHNGNAQTPNTLCNALVDVAGIFLRGNRERNRSHLSPHDGLMSFYSLYPRRKEKYSSKQSSREQPSNNKVLQNYTLQTTCLSSESTDAAINQDPHPKASAYPFDPLTKKRQQQTLFIQTSYSIDSQENIVQENGSSEESVYDSESSSDSASEYSYSSPPFQREKRVSRDKIDHLMTATIQSLSPSFNEDGRSNSSNDCSKVIDRKNEAYGQKIRSNPAYLSSSRFGRRIHSEDLPSQDLLSSSQAIPQDPTLPEFSSEHILERRRNLSSDNLPYPEASDFRVTNPRDYTSSLEKLTVDSLFAHNKMHSIEESAQRSLYERSGTNCRGKYSYNNETVNGQFPQAKVVGAAFPPSAQSSEFYLRIERWRREIDFSGGNRVLSEEEQQAVNEWRKSVASGSKLQCISPGGPRANGSDIATNGDTFQKKKKVVSIFIPTQQSVSSSKMDSPYSLEAFGGGLNELAESRSNSTSPTSSPPSRQVILSPGEQRLLSRSSSSLSLAKEPEGNANMQLFRRKSMSTLPSFKDAAESLV